MKRINRLPGGREFKSIFRGGRRVDSPFLSVRFITSKLSCARFGFVIPRAVSRRAVTRNKIRRRAREWIRRNDRLLSLPYDFAIFFKSGVVELGRKNFYEELRRIFEKIRT